MIDRPVRTYLLTIYEIEHDGDLDNALDSLNALPEVNEVNAISVDYDHAESADIRLATIGVDRKDLEALLDRADVIGPW
jgi:hypothetical protein